MDSETADHGGSVDVSPLDEIPQPWRDAMEAAGLHSLRDLAAKAGLGTSTVSALIYGGRTSSESTMQAASDSLRLPVTTIREWASAARGEVGPYSPPAEANQLNNRQRKALDELIRSIVVDARRSADLSTPVPDAAAVPNLRGLDHPAGLKSTRDTPRSR